MSSFWDVKLRNLGSWLVTKFHPVTLPEVTSTAVRNYRAKYITRKNAKMTPFIHFVAFCVIVNYALEYRHLKKHEAFRKYH